MDNIHNAMNLHPSQLEMNARLQAQANFLAEMDHQSAAFRGAAASPPTLLQQQRLLQQQEAMARRVTIPKPQKSDVILGRGKPFQNWPGNQFMLSLCDCYRDRYHAAERAQKNHIIEEVKDIIKGRGGRFLQRHENFKMNCWVEVSERISYRKIGHAFRSNSRRLTAEKNAEIAAAEEAARTGKKYEEVLAESRMNQALSESKLKKTDSEAAEEEEEPKLPPPRDLPLSVTMNAATNTAPAANLPMPSAGLPMASATMPPSADAMLQLEVRRRNLEERENRLLQMKLEMQAELEARNAMSTAGFGAPGSLHNARGMNPMAMGGMSGMGGMGGLASAQAFGGGMSPAILAQQRAVMASKLTPSFAALQGASGMGMGMGGAGLFGAQNAAAMPGMNMNSMTPAEMELAMVRAGRGTLGSGTLGGPTHGDGMLVDMLVKRSQMAKPPTSLAEINAIRRKSLSEEDPYRLGGMVPVEKKKNKKKKKRKHNKH